MSRRRLPRGQLLLLLALLCPPVRGDCNLPPEVRNAQPDLNGSTSFPEQSFVTYKCDEGFLKIPDKVDTVTCLENGQWSDIEEFCGRSCNVPTRLVFASLKKEYITKNFYPVGFTVEYECRPGFQRTSFSSAKSTCLQNLEWSEVDTFCKKKSCPNPGDIQNGNINITTDILFGSQIFFSCNTGYKLLGADSSFCSVVGKTVAWSDPLPTCTEIFCPEPPEIDNGIIKGESENYVYGQSISYECDRGFILVGKSSIYCTLKNNDGEWNDTPPECKEKSLTSKVPPTVHKHTTVNFPSTEVPLMSQNPTTINVPATKIPSASQKPSTVHAPGTRIAPKPQKPTKGNIPATEAPPTPQKPNTANIPATQAPPKPQKPRTESIPYTEAPPRPQKPSTANIPANVPATQAPPMPQKPNTTKIPAMEALPTPQKPNTTKIPAMEAPPTPQKPNTANIPTMEAPPTPQKLITTKTSATKASALVLIAPVSRDLSTKTPPTTQNPTIANTSALQTIEATHRFTTAKASITHSPVTQKSITSGVSMTKGRFTSAHITATQHVPVTRPTKKFHSTRTSTTQKEISTSDADDLIYGHTCVITLTVLLVVLVIIG